MALSLAARSKLARVLGMLGSDFDGERAAAGLAANRIVKDVGTSWDELLLVQDPRSDRTVPPPRPDNPHEGPDYRGNLDLCRRHLGQLNLWERGFACSLAQRRKPPSPSQIQKLAEIADALRKGGKS